MSFLLFPYLNKTISKARKLPDSRDKVFYKAHSSYFAKYPSLSKYAVIPDTFSLIKANVILQSLINKEEIEARAKVYNTSSSLSAPELVPFIYSRLPYVTLKEGEKTRKIYVPFFSNELNEGYSENPALLKDSKFAEARNNPENVFTDPFRALSFALFESPFTDLVKIARDDEQELEAFYHIDTETIFVIDKEGGLEEQIPLFETEDHPRLSKTHLFPRLVALMDFYFAGDRDAFIDALSSSGFISEKTYSYILKQEAKKDGIIEGTK